MSSLEDALNSKSCEVCGLDPVLCYTFSNTYNRARIEEISRTIRVVLEENRLKNGSEPPESPTIPLPPNFHYIRVTDPLEWKWVVRHLKNYEPRLKAEYLPSGNFSWNSDEWDGRKKPTRRFRETDFLDCFNGPPTWANKYWWVIMLVFTIGFFGSIIFVLFHLWAILDWFMATVKWVFGQIGRWF